MQRFVMLACLMDNIFKYKMKFIILCFLFLSLCINTSAQQSMKTLNAKRTTVEPKIDGILNENIWRNAPLATDFIAFQPIPGVAEDTQHKTEVYLLYDDQAIYVAAKMHELDANDISKELTNRDQMGNSDFLLVALDTYNDKINAQEFAVTAAGVQFDAKFSAQGEDENWNAVWESAVKIDGNVWVVEMKIPYSALRFASKDVQNWGLNIVRNRQKFQQKLTWNKLDPARNGFINQEGELVGIEKVKAPVRLSISPYLSNYVNHYPINQPGAKNTTNSVNGGMDIKYGINESFTLDMTLVPDFGQVQSDNQVLNLSPFEVRFDENRQFFTEGTELFNKGDLFYSRRVGSAPINASRLYNALSAKDKIIENPAQTKLVNASKISGRTAKGLGIGLFNAVSQKTQGIIEHPDGTRTEIEIAPLSNYNILVLDQNLKNNSSVSFINSNVLRAGNTYDANVSALVFDLNTKENKYNLNGAAKMSRLFGGDFTKPNVGYSYQINPSKQSGNFNYSYNFSVVDDKYDPNDLGILFNNNFITNSFSFNYTWYKATKWYNQLRTYFNTEYVRRYNPNTYQSRGTYFGSRVQFKNLWSFNTNINLEAEGNDFYEPRIAGRVFRDPATQGISFNFNSNRSKKFNAGAFLSLRKRDLFSANRVRVGSFQNYRVNNKLSFGTDFSINNSKNYAGYIARTPQKDVIFSRRDVKTVENSFDVKYTFNNKMGLNLTARHYWSKLINKQFYTLNADGTLAENTTYNTPSDRSFNAFNVDMVYIWRFAPGSELSVVWKDATPIVPYVESNNYFRNFRETISSAQNNSFSIKILYYLDYLQLKRKSNT